MVNTDLRTLSNALGGSRELALFEAFALRAPAPISVGDASEYSGVAWATAHRLVQDWCNRGVLIPAMKRRKAVLYRLNDASPTIELLAHVSRLAVGERFESDLLDEGFPEYALQPVVPSFTELAEIQGPLGGSAISAMGSTLNLISTSNTTGPGGPLSSGVQGSRLGAVKSP